MPDHKSENTPRNQQDNKKVYFETQGCQMNVNDSELMRGLLATDGFEATKNADSADLIILNTCQIRGHSEDKAYSYLGRWKKLKKANPNLKIAMAGCVSQQNKEEIFKRAPHVDIVLGTQNIQDIPQLVQRALDGESQILKVDKQREGSTYDYTTDVAPIRESDISAWVTIIEGCDYFCTYCVVPYTRGRQISRKPDSIIQEVRNLADHGFKEITLLGQTVDSYGKDFAGSSIEGYGLAKLFETLNDIDGLERIRFMTSHPLDLTDEIIEAVADLPKVMEYIHIPMQAGDDTVLERMKRGYTSKEYYDLVDKIHDKIPNVAVSGDYIVGFPGETHEQFQRSIESVYRAQMDSANTAAYSARKQTPAGIWETRDGEEVPAEVKQERLGLLNEAIGKQAWEINKHYQDQTVEILVEGPSRRNPERLTGRTRNNKVVNFETQIPEHLMVGQLVNVKISKPQPFSLMGHVEDEAKLAEKLSITLQEPALV